MRSNVWASHVTASRLAETPSSDSMSSGNTREAILYKRSSRPPPSVRCIAYIIISTLFCSIDSSFSRLITCWSSFSLLPHNLSSTHSLQRILPAKMKLIASAILLLASLPCLQATPLAADLSLRGTTAKAATKGTSSVYNVLKPTVGCVPATCGARCKRDREERDASGLLSRADAPVTPAAKTEAGLNAWTKQVYASAPKDLDIGTPQYPTMQFFKWEDLKDTKFVTVAGLFGCASVVVVSDCGVYMVSRPHLMPKPPL